MTLYSQAVEMGSHTLKNPVVMAPLTRNRAELDGTPGALAIEYYSQRATAGLIVTEATQISPMAQGYIATPGVYSDAQITAWKKITNAVHAKGGTIFLQLWHVGRISHTSLLPDNAKPVAPSAIQAKSQTFTAEGPVETSMPRELSEAEITETVADYKRAAECAKEAGFDGVEVHAANGYLIDQFLRDGSNKRTDSYGGSVENRSKFLFEVLDAVTSVWSAGSVGIRLSPTGAFNDMKDSDPEALFGSVISKLNTYKLSYLHIVEKFPGIESSSEDLKIVQNLKDQWQGFYIANGDYNQEEGLVALESGYADAISFGRAYIANPDLAERLEANADLNEADASTFYGGDAKGYTDYPYMTK